MKNNRIKDFVKKNRFIYLLYYLILSALVNLMKIFVKTDDKLILFVSYGGRHFCDSPKCIYEGMLRDPRFKNYKLVWAFSNPSDFDVENKIKIDSFKYFKTALKASCWVTNVMIERALNFSGKKTFYFFTTHGALVKLGGKDIKKGSSFESYAKFRYDICIAQSEFEKKILQSQFDLTPDKIIVTGMPKNDKLVSYTEDYRDGLRRKIGIPKDKIAILYAPTFREYTGSMMESFDLNIERMRKELGDRFVLLYRSHPVVASTNKVGDDFFIDVTKYEIVEELMIASDILVSDYSGIIFDYCILNRPIILYTYDYEQYSQTRGLYFDIRKELPYAMSENELIKKIKDIDFEEYIKIVSLFKQKYSTVYGKATEKCVDIIYDKIANTTSEN